MSCRRFFVWSMLLGVAMVTLCSAADSFAAEPAPWVVYEGTAGPGVGKHIVLISGDEEYRSEEGLPQLGRILAKHHGFKCTVLFSIDAATGEINPNNTGNIPGLEAVDTADLVIMLLRFRDLPNDQMRHIVDYVESGKPIIGLRTATHAFNIGRGDAEFKRYSWNNREWDGGFGRQVLGETWISHHGHHKAEATRGIIVPEQQNHPILKGIEDGSIFGPTDVYGVKLPLPGDSLPLVLGQVVKGMQPEDPPVEGPKNDPMMPVAWTKSYTGTAGKAARVFTTTMGSSTDLENAPLRRLLVNAAYWCLQMEEQIDPNSSVEIVGEFKATPYGFNGFQKGVKPSELFVEGLSQ
ncbi:MAG: ThuA domain-containing protein [Planctomycetaceae bacterium]